MGGKGTCRLDIIKDIVGNLCLGGWGFSSFLT